MEQRFCYGCMRPKQQSPICEHCGFDERQINMKHQLPIGTVLNNQYILGKVLGQGGFGITYIGWDRLLDMPVAIKEYFPNGIVYRNVTAGPNVEFYSSEDEQVFLKHKERFLREARTLAQLASLPEIVQVKTFFEANHTAYIVMEFVEGVTLKNYLKQLRRPLTVSETMQIIGPVLRGLSRVHEKNLIHRDISPDNIMLQHNGGVKLIDFGTVRYMNDVQRSKSTESVLKPGFAPMEQYNTQGNIGTWTDVYAVCATIHYCLSGRLPADAPSRIESGERLSILESIPGIPSALIRVLEQGMKIRVNERIQTIAELEQKLYNPSIVKETSPFVNGYVPDEACGKKERIKKLLLAGTGIVAVAVLVMVLILGFGDLGSSKSTLVGKAASSSASTGSGSAVPAPAVQHAEVDESAWRDNLLMADSIDADLDDPSNSYVLGHRSIRRKDVITVTFLDSLDGMPSDSWDVSHEHNGSVMAWASSRGSGYDLYIAADGGINGKNSCARLFQDYINVQEIHFQNKFHTDYTESMLYMFKGCESLQYVDVQTFNTSNCNDMFAMFDNCASLTTLDVTGFDTSKVTDMALMFSDCKNVSELNVTGFDTSNVIDMAFMFDNCESIAYLDVSSFDTSDVWDMSYMFYGCKSLKTLRLGSFDRSSVTSYKLFFHTDKLPDGTIWLSMFEGSGSAASSSGNWENNLMMADYINPDLEYEYNSHVLGHPSIRRRDIRTITFVDSLQQMGTNNWDVSYNQNGSVMAWVKDSGYSAAKYDLYIGANGGINGEKAASDMFRQYINVSEIRFNGAFHTENAKNMSYMFRDCESLVKVDLQTLDTSSCTDMFAMFDNCLSIDNLDVSGFETSNVTDMALMFCDCASLKTLNVTGFDTINVIDMAFMFDGCESLTSLDVSSFDTSDVGDMSYMFYRCYSLKSLKLGRFDTSSVTSYGSFYQNEYLPDGTYWRSMFE